MLSRHNLRVKVLQTVYAYIQSPEPDMVFAENAYLKSVQDSFRLFLYNMLYLQRIGEYDQKNFDIKNRKFVPSEEDQQVTLCLFQNPIIQHLKNNEAFQRLLKREVLLPLVDNDLVRRIYHTFTKLEYYESYHKMQNPPISEHQYALVKLYKTMMEDEVYVEHVSDIFTTWDDDQSLIYGAIKRAMRDLPENEDFYKEHRPNEEFVHEFGKELLYRTIRYDQELQDLITPKLKNWKEDRVALIDMILMKMALCEFLYFPSIPTKVTINEYVAMAKDFSTDNSKRFVNGILDRLMKELMDMGRIEKLGRGLKEE